MGWWGTGVMEGDSPMDLQCEVEIALLGHTAGNSDEDDDSDDDGYAADTARLNEMLKDAGNVEKTFKMIDVGYAVDVQAFGYLVMTAGGPIDSFKEVLLGAIDADESELWIDTAERREVMAKFRQQVLSYDGTPIKDETTGLLDRMCEELESGRLIPN